ncbi:MULTISPECIES: nucleotidyltransferase [Chishuiella]|uniref:nucleotidyltransferase domain-containing protein n=1 Tax=Chishuiella TaxID=1572663 RepID=UPI0028AA95F5|nr:nucleotidyltransferase [Chishuiella sp.]
MINENQKKQFNDLLEILSENLSITKTQHEAAVQSYVAVGKFLSNEYSSLAEFQPYIKPQGSFIIGTTIQSIDEDGDIDLDVVCEFKKKPDNWTQFHLKNAVGDRLKESDRYREMLDEEGRRCWTLKYRENAESANQRYHMDILPALISSGYSIILEKAMSADTYEEFDKLRLSITDKEESGYNTETRPEYWKQSNPYGYAIWFMNIAKTINGIKKRTFSLNEAVKPAPEYQDARLPLQRVVQLLKRHRDLYFKNQTDPEVKKQKPISCIITTLAARAYRGEEELIDALWGVVNRMENEIEFKLEPSLGKEVEWISNPTNISENFADRWNDEGSVRRENFYRWLAQVKADLSDAQSKTGLQNISESLKNSFGKDAVLKTFSDYGTRSRLLTESGNNYADRKSGILGTVGATLSNVSKVKAHNFHGVDKD